MSGEMKKKAWIGVDPGASGCMVLLTSDNQIEYYDYCNPTMIATRLFEWHSKYDIQESALEDVNMNPMIKQGVAKLMQNKGEWIGLLTMLFKPLHFVRPQKWQKATHRKQDGSDTKTRSVNMCVRLFPEYREIFYGGKKRNSEERTLKDGRADALLLAYYIRDKL